MTEKLGGWRWIVWTGHISLTVLKAEWRGIWEVRMICVKCPFNLQVEYNEMNMRAK
jgi:hypothetical protein